MTWGLGGECILLLGHTLARNTVRILDLDHFVRDRV